MQKEDFTPLFNSIDDLLSQYAKNLGEKDAVVALDVDTENRAALSYSELAELVRKTANFLFAKGIRKGDRIAFLFHITPEVLILELAAHLIGASSVPLDAKRDTLERKIFKLKDTKAKLLFVRKDAETTDREIEELKKTIELVVLKDGNALFELIKDQLRDFSFPVNKSLDTEYVVLYTSGTTSNPKGVPLTLKSCIANAQGIIEWQQFSEKDRFSIVLPLHHINSTIFSLSMLLVGGTIILSSRYSVSKFWDVISQEKATCTSVVPTILHDLLSRAEEFSLGSWNIASLKRILVGSAPVLPEETMRFMEVFGVDVIQGYGQTETALRVTGVPVTLEREQYLELVRKNTIGKELLHANVAILKEDGSEAKEGEEGEICIRGPVVAKEYLNSPEETEKVFGGGWFHSEDTGSFQMINGEKYFFIKGRTKEIIIKGGINMSPSAIEDALLKSFPKIDKVCVVGYEDARMGEDIAAVVVFPKDYSSDKKQEILSAIKGQGRLGHIPGLSRYESPTMVVEAKEELPTTSTGKIQRVFVKEMVAHLVREDVRPSFYCRLIQPNEKEILGKAVDINNSRWGISSSVAEFKERAKNGYLIGVFDEKKELWGTLSALLLPKAVLLESSTWHDITGKGSLSTHDPKGDTLVCVAISVKAREQDRDEIKISVDEDELCELAPLVVEDYLKTDLDNVVRFHRKKKGSLEKGAEVIKILPNGREEDKDSIGYNILMAYPPFAQKGIVRSHQESPSIVLLEYALSFASQHGCNEVIACSRPAQFRIHLAKAIDDSIAFEPVDAVAFKTFAQKVQTALGKSS